ncbi:MAG: enoyl-CoA hydratase/isomerase family protein [Ignavibacteria bacterium]|nr:enoyl-CoA hydratase/isomerase family protein [Ignavibacteria bacterium]
MSYNKILTEEKDNTVKITLNRPEKRNSLDEEMITRQGSSSYIKIHYRAGGIQNRVCELCHISFRT